MFNVLFLEDDAISRDAGGVQGPRWWRDRAGKHCRWRFATTSKLDWRHQALQFPSESSRLLARAYRLYLNRGMFKLAGELQAMYTSSGVALRPPIGSGSRAATFTRKALLTRCLMTRVDSSLRLSLTGVACISCKQPVVVPDEGRVCQLVKTPRRLNCCSKLPTCKSGKGDQVAGTRTF